jgi:uncharacterized protein (TIGR02678 family)
VTATTSSEHDTELEAQRVTAFRALLRTPLLGNDRADFGLVRRHFPELKRRFSELLGYELVMRADHVRLRKHPVAVDATRPARVVPATKEKVAPDRWRAFTRRHYALFALALAALERSGPQTTISMLAGEVRDLAREDGIPLDLDVRGHRKTLAEAVELLAHLGVLALVDGEAERWVRADTSGEEALYDIRHSLLGDVLVSRAVTDATTAAELVAAADDYPPTDDGRRDRLRHRVARRLVEEPVLYLDELADDEREYYASSQRPHIDARVAGFTGYDAERRAEGTAMVEPAQQSRALTDLRFPFRLADRQAALLLCEPLAETHYEGQPGLTRAELLRRTRELVELYGEHWGRSADGESVALLLDEALQVLGAMKLVDIDGELVRPLPAIARFSSAEVRYPDRHNEEEEAT